MSSLNKLLNKIQGGLQKNYFQSLPIMHLGQQNHQETPNLRSEKGELQCVSDTPRQPIIELTPWICLDEAFPISKGLGQTMRDCTTKCNMENFVPSITHKHVGEFCRRHLPSKVLQILLHVFTMLMEDFYNRLYVMVCGLFLHNLTSIPQNLENPHPNIANIFFYDVNNKFKEIKNIHRNGG